MAEDRSDTREDEISRFDVAMETVEDLMTLMGMDVDLEGEELDEQINLHINGEDSVGLVGKKGRTLDALQFIVNKMVSRQGGERKLVVLDADGYRQRREAALIELADRLGAKALEERKIVRLNPMSARDRRIIHMTLRDVMGLETRSEGEGEDRRLLIVPEG